MTKPGTSKQREQSDRPIFRPSATLATVACICTTLVVLLNHATHWRIEHKRQQIIIQQLQAVLPAGNYNNNLLNDTLSVSDAHLGSGAPHTIWRARFNQQPIAAIVSATAPDGYGGPITLLVAITVAGEITGVRVITHRETPGLGDEIEIRKSDWIRGFDGHSLVSLSSAEWQVKKDGGHFEHFTGATVTPRAITTAVHDVLIFFRHNQEMIFADKN